MSACLEGGTLAASVLTLDQAVRNVVRTCGASVPDALRMASETPARVLGLSDRGSLAAGCRADFVLLDRDLTVEATILRGVPGFTRAARP